MLDDEEFLEELLFEIEEMIYFEALFEMEEIEHLSWALMSDKLFFLFLPALHLKF